MSGEKLVKDLSYEAHFLIYKLLLPPAPGRDWKTLADKMGYTQETILYYECLNNPVKELISDYESKGKPISELLTFLEEMERIDLVTDLEKFVGKAKEENSFMNQLKHFEFSDLIRYTICLNEIYLVKRLRSAARNYRFYFSFYIVTQFQPTIHSELSYADAMGYLHYYGSFCHCLEIVQISPNSVSLG